MLECQQDETMKRLLNHLFIVKSVHRSEDQSISVISGLHDKKNSLQVILFLKSKIVRRGDSYPESYDEQDDKDQETENKEHV